jgi:hypothetical protein
MNPGYLSYIAITLSVIFLSFGWRPQAIGNGSIRAAMWFCAGWLISVTLHWELTNGTAGTFAYLPLITLTAVVLLRRRPLTERASVLSFALLLGAVVSLIQLLEAIDPLVIVLHPALDPLIVLWILAICYTRNASLQFVLVSISLVANDAYMSLMYMEWEQAYFGDRVFQDAWWLSAIAVRTGSLAASVFGMWNQGLLARLLGLLRMRK